MSEIKLNLSPGAKCIKRGEGKKTWAALRLGCILRKYTNVSIVCLAIKSQV